MSAIYGPHVAQMRRLLEGPDPICVVPEADDDWLGEILAGLGKVYSIDAAGTYQTLGTTPSERSMALDAFLRDYALAAQRESGQVILWLRDVAEALQAPANFGCLKRIAAGLARSGRPVRVLLSGQAAALPPGLEHLARIEALDRPTRNCPETPKFMRAVLEGAGDVADDESLAAIFERVQGLEAAAIRRLLLRACHARQAGARHDLVHCVRQERNRLLGNGVIEVREVRGDVALGGLDVLRAHLKNVAALFEDCRRQPERLATLLEIIPKGMLLVGLPGCGKSLAAEVAAHELRLPLLQLHVGRLMDRFLGVSEARLDLALATARAAAPCVLWVDEIEKAIGGMGTGQGDSGTGARMLASILGWMQDNRHGVFVVATANALDHVPPELLRRGRFDHHFRLDLPSERERAEILQIHSALAPAECAPLVKQMDGYSGADIAAVVREARQLAQLRDSNPMLAAEHVKTALKEFSSQAKSFGARHKEMKGKLDAYAFTNASSAKGDVRPVRPEDFAYENLPVPLRLLIDSGESRLMRWDDPNPRMLELRTLDARRWAVLGTGDEAGITAENEQARYAVHVAAKSLILSLVHPDEIGGSSRGPAQMEIEYTSGAGFQLAIEGRRHLARSSRLLIGSVLDPLLWPYLAAPAAVLVHGDTRLEFEGAGAQRRAIQRAEGREAKNYAMRVEGGLLVLDAKSHPEAGSLHLSVHNGRVEVREGARTVANDQTKVPINGYSRALVDLFPVCGVVIGRTTVKELRELGRRTKTIDEETGHPYHNYKVDGLDVWYDYETKTADSLIIYSRNSMPARWAAFGFDWHISYTEWCSKLTSLGFLVNVTKIPKVVGWNKRKTLSAKVEACALSPIPIRITLQFDFGPPSTEDSGTLYSIDVALQEVR